jgi:pimeloyl-ACP methyl ester carboxylesterase
MPERSQEFLGEAQAFAEYAQLAADPVFFGRGVPRGDGHSVLVLPGLFGNDLYLQPLHLWLSRVGYRPIRSSLISNVGCPERLTVQIEQELARRRTIHPGTVSVIGHSRGGILGWAIAQRLGPDARHLILLGSPVGALAAAMRSGAVDTSQARQYANPAIVEASTRVRRVIDPECDFPSCGCPFAQQIAQTLPAYVKVTTIASQSDPIVPAATARIEGARNFVGSGTHSGLVVNKNVYPLIARALAE